jgi:glycosyltransferase involved in cell wall biosynthesis
MPNLSVVIITRNEESNIARCLRSVKMADEIIVADSGSTDRTIEIARNMGALVISIPWTGYGQSKREAVDKASGKWILSLDADEVISPELADEISDIVGHKSEFAGYFIKRKTNFLGKWIYHCGWYPDYLLRLFKKSQGNFDNNVVHEQVILEGRTGYLKSEILHYSYTSLEQYFEKSNNYTTLGAEEIFGQGKRAEWYHLTIKPLAAFFKHYFAKLGFLDGMTGFIISCLSSSAVFTKYIKLRELARKPKRNTNDDV